MPQVNISTIFQGTDIKEALKEIARSIPVIGDLIAGLLSVIGIKGPTQHYSRQEAEQIAVSVGKQLISAFDKAGMKYTAIVEGTKTVPQYYAWWLRTQRPAWWVGGVATGNTFLNDLLDLYVSKYQSLPPRVQMELVVQYHVWAFAVSADASRIQQQFQTEFPAQVEFVINQIVTRAPKVTNSGGVVGGDPLDPSKKEKEKTAGFGWIGVAAVVGIIGAAALSGGGRK